MKILTVFLIIFLIIAMLMSFSISIDVSYINGVPDIQVKYFLFKIFPIKKKTAKKIKGKKIKKKSSDKQSNENSSENKTELNSEKNADKSSKKSKKKKSSKKTDTVDLIDTILKLVEISAEDIKKAGGKIAVKDVYIYFLSCNEDAYNCAVNYGIMNAIVYNALGVICSLFKTTFKSVSIGLRYNQSGNVFDLSFTLKARLGTGVHLALKILINYAKVIYRKSKEVV